MTHFVAVKTKVQSQYILLILNRNFCQPKLVINLTGHPVHVLRSLTVQDGHGVVVDVLARLDEHDGEDDDEPHGDVGAVDEVRVQWQPAAARDKTS